ncbi:hypothetical protein AVEN_65822-1 [Araneus ventricosus]|uniref:Uncharacterized protein n=1 Tax=Araneus ventricosus TaxID=182803 RepID=A0A4Y2PKV3_ARAVE|nr:hypothetical protein AVEN_65822-1 [Araneus ventricosus]
MEGGGWQENIDDISRCHLHLHLGNLVTGRLSELFSRQALTCAIVLGGATSCGPVAYLHKMEPRANIETVPLPFFLLKYDPHFLFGNFIPGSAKIKIGNKL